MREKEEKGQELKGKGNKKWQEGKVKRKGLKREEKN